MSIKEFISRNSTFVSIILACSTIIGLIRESSIAFMFGASGITDAYLVALIIPTVFTGTVMNSITRTFVTVYSSYLARNEQVKAWRTTNVIISLFSILLLGLALLFLFFTPVLVKIVAPTYSGYFFDLTVQLTRLMAPVIYFSGLLGILIGINNSHHSFIGPASVGLISNIVIVLSIYTLGYHWGIYGLAIGSTLGVMLQFFIQIPSIYKIGYRFELLLDYKDEGFQEVIKLVIPFIVAALSSQVCFIVDRILATGLPTGRVSALYFANKLVLLPQSILTGAVGMVVFPLFVETITKQDWEGLSEALIRSIRLIVIAILPIVVGFYVLRIPLVRLLFEHGMFNSYDANITGNTIVFFLGVPFFGAFVSILGNVYYAFKKMKIAVGISTTAVLINIALSLLFVKNLQQNGLALANSIALLINSLLLFIGLFKFLKLDKKVKLPYKKLFDFLIKSIFAATLMGVAVNKYYQIFNNNIVSIDKKLQLFTTFSSIMVGFVIYSLILIILRIEEVYTIMIWVNSKFKRISKRFL